MAYRKILTWPNPKLSRISNHVDVFDDGLRHDIQDMYDTMNVVMGAGLAASQIGMLKRVVILNCRSFNTPSPLPWRDNSDLWVMVNPEIKPLSKDVETWTEACLSVPLVNGEVSRLAKIEVKFQDESGNSHVTTVDWPLAGAVQHECDHLDGILYLDRMKKKSAVELKRRLSWIRQRKIKDAKKLARRLKKENKKVIDTRLQHGPGKRKKKKNKKK